MINKNFIKVAIILLLTLNTKIIYCTFTPIESKQINTDLQIHTNNASYTIGESLIEKGYRIQKKNNKLSLLQHGKEISAEEFYAPSIGPDQAYKLLIVLKNTLKNANIFLNDRKLEQTTDKSGNATTDGYREKGTYKLSLSNNQNKESLNYIFSLDKPLKLECTNTTSFKCDEKFY